MSYLVYSDQPQPFSGNMKINEVNPHPFYLRHYSNLLFLTFIAQQGTKQEAYQARKELVICERKLKFWDRHPDFRISSIAKEIQTLKNQWEGKRQ